MSLSLDKAFPARYSEYWGGSPDIIKKQGGNVMDDGSSTGALPGRSSIRKRVDGVSVL